MIKYFIVPGLGNSGPEHWQSQFERSGNNFQRIEQKEWEAPACEDWISTIEKALEGQDLSRVVLIGHSLGCTAIVQWYARYKHIIRGALLVAPSDIEAQHYTFPATGFTPIPLLILPFKTIVVASTDDPWVSFERARFFADQWGSEFIDIGPAGHINVASGHTAWDQGMNILLGMEGGEILEF